MTDRETLMATESMLAQMDETRRLAAQTARTAATFARETNALLGKVDEEDLEMDELADSADSAERWAAQTDGDRHDKSLAEYFETTRNCLNEAVWILDNARAALREERPDMLGKPPAWA